MVAGQPTITCSSESLSYGKACEIADRVAAIGGNETVYIGLESVARTTTAALARLIALRCSLRRSGRDLRIGGLQGQAEYLYEFNRMKTILPRYA